MPIDIYVNYIFPAGGRADGRACPGNIRGPRGPKKFNVDAKDSQCGQIWSNNRLGLPPKSFSQYKRC